MLARKVAVLTFSLILASVILIIMAFIPIIFRGRVGGSFFEWLLSNIPLLLIFVGGTGIIALIISALFIGFALRHPFNPINSLVNFFARLHVPSGVSKALSALSLVSFIFVYMGMTLLLRNYFIIPFLSLLLSEISLLLADVAIYLFFLWMGILIIVPSWNIFAKIFTKAIKGAG